MSNVPRFPEFKKITLDDRNHINSFTSVFKPYSDFNFTNLWAWDTDGQRMISNLNNNLVILFTDYITAKPFLSFIGNNHLEETANELLDYSKEKFGSDTLNFICEELAIKLSKTNLLVTEDNNNHDYIFSVQELAHLRGSSLKKKRHLSNRFQREYPNNVFNVTKFFLSDNSTKRLIRSLFRKWEKGKVLANKTIDSSYETIAINRLLDTHNDHNLLLSTIYNDDTMIAFGVDEIITNDYAISHFIKADFQYRGIYEYFNESVSKHLLSEGVSMWNWEQDLNLEGLRKLKMSYKPADFLKKYKVGKTVPDSKRTMLVY